MMIIAQAQRKMAIRLGGNGSWGWELYCELHAPKHDTHIVNIIDYKRMEENNTAFYGCVLCPGHHSSILMPDEDEKDMY